jgi:hypothetical protein
MSAFLEGLGKVFGKVADQFQGRIERLKNEKASLEKEKNELSKINMDINNPEHRKKAARLSVVIDRINELNRLLGNKAQD